MNGNWTRRSLGAAGLAAALGARAARAQGRVLNVLAHRVHQNSLTTGAAGDLTAPWRGATGTEIRWTTFDPNPLQDRLFREASLDRTDFGVGFLVNNRATTAAARLLEPLDRYLSSAAIEEFGDIAPGLTQAMTVEGRLIGVPFRHATQGLFYNEALLEQRGITAPPRTLEELVDQAKRLTFRSEDGRPVVGMVLASELSVFPVIFARAFGGDFIGPNLALVPDPEALEKGIATMRGMYEAGAIQRAYATTTNEDQPTWLMQGRAAFAVMPFARHAQVNSPEGSRFPGRIKAVEFPLSETVRGGRMASVTEFWGMSILANARDKDHSWDFIRAMSSKAVALGAAKNGNGPVRVSTYADPGFAASQPLAAVEAAALANARVPLPAFPEAVRAQAIFVEEVQLAVLGRKTPREAVTSTVARVRPLMPG